VVLVGLYSRPPRGVAQPEGRSAVGERIVNFSFDEVAVPAFAKLVGELTGRRFVVSDGVKGKITVVSPRVRREEVYPLFVSILEAAGCSVVQEGDIYRIVSLPRQSSVAPVVGVGEEIPKEGVITKIMRLKHVSASEIERVIEGQVGAAKSGAVAAIDETNHLIVTDTARSVRRYEKIVAEIDRPGLARVTEIVPLQYAGAEDMAGRLNLAMADSAGRAELLKKRLPATAAERSRGRRSSVVASPHSNSLILVGSATRIAELKAMIGKMDVAARAGRGRLNAIFLKYLSAEEAAKSISSLLEKSEKGEKTGGPERGRISIEASVANNALLVDAMPGDFEVVKKLVEQLDLMPEQVHIEVVIAEVSMTEGLDLGVEMAALDMPAKVGSTVVQGSSMFADAADSFLSSVQEGLFPRGITIGVAHGSSTDDDGNIVSSYPAIINIDAVKKDGRFKIRSAPSLVALNNTEASISIVNEIPVLESTIEGGSGTSRDVIQNIERKEVGIKLKLTPHIIPGGEVRMELNPTIEAVIEEGPEGEYSPTVARREVSTTVVVPDGEMIVIGGLTQKGKTKSVKRVPILGSIPLLGWLFRHTSDLTEDTNVLIFVTPRIVTERAKAGEMTLDMEEKTGLQAHEEQ